MSAAEPCRFCGGEVRFALAARERMLGLDESFDYGECARCAALQIEAIPDSLDPYYAAGYYTRASAGRVLRPSVVRRLRRSWSWLRLRHSRIIRAISGRRYARFDWFRYTGVRLDDPILDVGCGAGRLLTNLANDGFTNLVGIDPRGPSVAESMPGLRFARERPEEHAGRYRLVMAHHSFEHMPDPVAGFASLARLVDDGGALLLRVPLADSWARRHYEADWVQLDAPRHLQIPTRRAIELLAPGVGLRLVRVEDDSGPFQIWGSELYRLKVSLADGGRGGRRALSLVTRLRARLQARRLRRAALGDQACFYLRRESGKARSAEVVSGAIR